MGATSIESLRRERDNLRRRLETAEAETERVRAEQSRQIAALTVRADEAWENARAAEARLEALTT
jgi:hypothetical protein